ncbi:MAG: molybdopterin guanine dinucleotide biosynthesis protein MoaE [Methanosaeta sp. PtaB.Bin018]|nr:MAG: molybdopterin guanine dinucleotide biosynthesis protein MoaE [Methanosaeta sp. PtaB.Bin018]OPY44399.1 MAG: molybdopterin guanine dinucleotide biosynthesis protein MoaE [Methanosaeta sp. PtaU1.Bin016]
MRLSCTRETRLRYFLLSLEADARLIRISDEDFSLDEMVRAAKRDDAGAVVTFLGTVRDDGIIEMQLEAYREAALPVLEGIKEEAEIRFNLKSVQIIHRIGQLSVGDNIVAIVCSAGHRDEAFQGCRYIIEELKSKVPIWKKEIGKDVERWV